MYNLTNYFNDISKYSLSDIETIETIQPTIESTILNEKSQTEINVISTTSLYGTQDSTLQTEQLTENDSTVQTEQSTENDSTLQAEQLTENDSTVQTEKPAERVDNTEEVKYCPDNKKRKDNQDICICDDKKGYYNINNNIFLDVNCYNEQTKPENFYLNPENKIYEICKIVELVIIMEMKWKIIILILKILIK